MNFQKGQRRDEPEINLIPLIDLFLVIIIFLMITTTFSKFAELEITLPSADAERTIERPADIHVAVGQDGKLAIDGTPLPSPDPRLLAQALKAAAAERKEPTIVINADARATHQSVINVMEAARIAEIPRITFATQTSADGK